MSVRKRLDMQISVGCRWRGRLLKTWIKAMRKGLVDLEISDSFYYKNVLHGELTHVADHDNVGLSYGDEEELMMAYMF